MNKRLQGYCKKLIPNAKYVEGATLLLVLEEFLNNRKRDCPCPFHWIAFGFFQQNTIILKNIEVISEDHYTVTPIDIIKTNLKSTKLSLVTQRLDLEGF